MALVLIWLRNKLQGQLACVLASVILLSLALSQFSHSYEKADHGPRGSGHALVVAELPVSEIDANEFSPKNSSHQESGQETNHFCSNARCGGVFQIAEPEPLPARFFVGAILFAVLFPKWLSFEQVALDKPPRRV